MAMECADCGWMDGTGDDCVSVVACAADGFVCVVVGVQIDDGVVVADGIVVGDGARKSMMVGLVVVRVTMGLG